MVLSIQNSIDAAIRDSENKFSYRWERLHQDKNSITMRCVLTHILGYSEFADFENVIDHKAFMSEGQKIAACRTFAKRYTLMDVVGLEADEDSDNGADLKVQGNGKENEGIRWLTEDEIKIAMKAMESASDVKATWERIRADCLERGDKAAKDELKQYLIKMMEKRHKAAEKQEAKQKESKDRPKREIAPGTWATLINDDELGKLKKRMEQVGIDNQTLIRESGFPIQKSEDIQAKDFDRIMDWLWEYHPIRQGITCISLSENKRLHIMMMKAKISSDEFKKFHHLNSTKDIPLAELTHYENMEMIIAGRDDPGNQGENISSPERFEEL